MWDDNRLWRDFFLSEGVPEAAELLRRAERAVYEKGETMTAGTTAEPALCLLVTGAARVQTRSDGETLLRILPPGSVFGAAGLFGAEGGPVSVITAVRHCEAAVIPESLLRELFSQYPRAAENYIRFLTDRVRYLNRKLSLVTGRTAESRVYALLRQQADEEGNLPGGVNMSRSTAMLNIGRTSLYRAVEGLESKGFIRREAEGWKIF